MAGSKSNYLSKKLVELPLGGVAFTAPAIWCALWTATLDDTSTGATAGEASYTGYARVQITNDQTTGFNASTGTTTATVTNKNTVTFGTSSSATQTMTFFAICDASTAGNMLYWASITSTAINNGDTPKVNAAGISAVED